MSIKTVADLNAIHRAKYGTQDKRSKDAETKKPGPFAEAAAKAGMSEEDYLIQRKHASPGMLRQMQKKEMEI